MSFFVRSRARRNQAFDEPFWKDLATWLPSITGKAVTMRTAIQVATVFACCRVIGNGMAQVPLKLRRESADGRSRIAAKDHPLYKLMALRPNSWQTSFEFRQMLAWHVELCGNAYVFKNRSVTGKMLELIPFAPGQVVARRDEYMRPLYDVIGLDGTMRTFTQDQVWHLRGPSVDGFQGLEVIGIAREAIGLAMATEESVAQLHKNGIRNSGVYSVEGTLDKTQHEALSAWVSQQFGGLKNTGKPMILDRAAKFLNTSMTSVDAQSHETRRMQVEQICSFFGVAPIKTGFADKTATFASAEEFNRAHREDCLAPRWEAFEQSAAINLLTDAEIEAGYYWDFVEEGLLRGSATQTKDVILGYVNGGLLSTNEGRALLDRNPDPDPASDRLRVPANIVGATATVDVQK
ncbi:phage portal protein [Pseudoduganella rivuli]|nr:phage portal protein [Pseudoduganella rivuli]